MATSSVHAQGSDRALLSRRETSTSSGFEVQVTDYGATGDGSTDDTENIQKALNALQKAGSGTVHFPKGNYMCSQLFLSGVKDSKILFDDGAQMTMYKSLSNWKKEGDSKPIYSPWFTVDSCNKLTVKGGTWNGDYEFWRKNVKNSKQYNPRPYMMRFSTVTDLTAQSITLNDAPHAHFKVGGKNSKVIRLNDLTFNSQVGSENTDGILLSGVTDAKVFDSHITNGDDCLKVSGKTRDVTFQGGSCTGGHGLTIGGGSDSLDVDGATWRDIDLFGMSYGARLKWTTKTSGQVKNVVYDDIRMTNVNYPLYITTGYQSSGERSSTFQVGDVTFKGITAKEDSSTLEGSGGKIKNAGFFDCEEKSQCKNIHLDNVEVHTSKEWHCTDCGGDMANGVSPDASQYFHPKTAVAKQCETDRDCPDGGSCGGSYWEPTWRCHKHCKLSQYATSCPHGEECNFCDDVSQDSCWCFKPKTAVV